MPGIHFLYLSLMIFLPTLNAEERPPATPSILFPAQEKLFDSYSDSQVDSSLYYPLWGVFHKWGQNTLAQNLSLSKVQSALAILEEHHDEFHSLFNFILDYETEKKQRMLALLREDVPESERERSFYDLLELEAQDFSQVILTLLDDQFTPSLHNNFALFLKHGQGREKEIIFGDFLQKLVNNEESTEENTDWTLQQAENFRSAYVLKGMEELRHPRQLRDRLQQEIFNLISLKETRPLSSGESAEPLSGQILPLLSLAAIRLAQDWEKHSITHSQNSDQSPSKMISCAVKDSEAQSFEVETGQMGSLKQEFAKRVEEALQRVNIIANSPEFLEEVENRQYWGISAQEVVHYLQKAKYRVSIGVKSMPSRVNARAAVCGDYIYLNSNKQHRFGQDLAGTLFHEITHNLGFFHDSKVPYPLGELLRVHYQRQFGVTLSKDYPQFPQTYILKGYFPHSSPTKVETSDEASIE